MKAHEREVYIELAALIDFSLCAFCVYYVCFGSACDDIEGECYHPVENVPGHDQEPAPTDDCWGFRKKFSVSLAADIVGIMLEKGWTSATWRKRDDGIYEIAGMV